MAARPMGVPVGELLFRGIADLGDLNLEVEILARERMVPVDGNMSVADRGHDHDLHVALSRISVEAIANLNIRLGDLGTRHFDHQLIFIFSVGLGGFDCHCFFIAFFKALKGGLKAWDDLADSLKVAERFVAERGLEDIAF